MLTDTTTDDLGITHEKGYCTERTVLVRATVLGIRIEAAVLLDRHDKPIDDLPAPDTPGGIEFAPMAAAVMAHKKGKSDSWRALLKGELVEAAVRSRLAE